MSDAEHILREFGEDLGMTGLGFGVRGNAVLQIESGRRLSMERAQDVVLVYLSQPIDYDAGDWMLRAWKRSHFSSFTQVADIDIQKAADQINFCFTIR